MKQDEAGLRGGQAETFPCGVGSRALGVFWGL